MSRHFASNLEKNINTEFVLWVTQNSNSFRWAHVKYSRNTIFENCSLSVSRLPPERKRLIYWYSCNFFGKLESNFVRVKNFLLRYFVFNLAKNTRVEAKVMATTFFFLKDTSPVGKYDIYRRKDKVLITCVDNKWHWKIVIY